MFSKEFTTAIESKQVAQQEAERSKFIVMKAEQEAKAAIIRAEVRVHTRRETSALPAVEMQLLSHPQPSPDPATHPPTTHPHILSPRRARARRRSSSRRRSRRTAPR
jgi:hypothetical protein